MNILFIDDDSLAFDIIPRLLQAGHRVMAAASLADAEECLTIVPGEAAFNAVLIDLDMNARLLPPDIQNTEMLAGWVFYEHFSKIYTTLNDKVIFLSGFVSRLRDEIGQERLSELRVVNKLDVDIEEKLLEALKSLPNARRTDT